MSDAFLASNAPRAYWSEARQPGNGLIFLAPWLAIYELGVLTLGGQSAESCRNGADQWMRACLQAIGCERLWLLPVLLIVALVGWQTAARQPWRISVPTQMGMWLESIVLACCLVFVGQLQSLAFQHYAAVRSAPWVSLWNADALPRILSFVGAGIYEEVLFRLCLLPLCYGVLRAARVPLRAALLISVLGTSLLFSAAHYVGPLADEFTLFSFVFRTLAGLYFATLFVLRGFGITAGCHAAYDILVGLILAQPA